MSTLYSYLLTVIYTSDPLQAPAVDQETSGAGPRRLGDRGWGRQQGGDYDDDSNNDDDVAGEAAVARADPGQDAP